MALTASTNPVAFGQPVTFTATVSAVPPGTGTPTGSVTFYDGITVIGTATLDAGVATFTTAALGLGSHTVTAHYEGSADFMASTGLPLSSIDAPLREAETKGLIVRDGGWVRPSERGFDFLSDLQELFLPA